MNKLNFKEDKYLSIALDLELNEDLVHQPEEAFFLLINGYDYESLDNLCSFICHHYFLSEEESYNLTQNLNLDKENKKTIMNLAKICVDFGMPLGNKLTNNRKNKVTSWISHCIFVGEVCANLAYMLELNPEVARTLGLLHDYGRRLDHSFNHVIEGFQSLVDLGWKNESLSCLTHSFLKGGRCSNNEKAIEGFYVDEKGNPKWNPEAKKDDITIFLEKYQYTEYDIILNIADLMATSECIISPYNRIKDIATRRTLDSTNRSYFLADITNVLIDVLKQTHAIDKNFEYIKETKDISLEQIEKRFSIISEYFFEVYQKFINENIESITLDNISKISSESIRFMHSTNKFINMEETSLKETKKLNLTKQNKKENNQ